MFDFTTKVDRRFTGAAKWEFAPDPVKGSGIIPLSVADMEFAVAPKIIDAAVEAAKHGIYGYTCVDDAYFNAVKNYYLRHHGYEIKRQWHTITNGIVTAVSAAVRVFSKPGDSVIVQTPVYYPFFRDIELNGRKIVENRLRLINGHYEMDFAGFEKLCKREDVSLFILCSPHNPVGRVWKKEELKKLGDIAKANGVFIVADEIHCDIMLEGSRHTSFMTMPEYYDNCLVCTAMSKTFNVAGLSCSDIFIPDEKNYNAYVEEQRRSTGTGLPYFGRAVGIVAHNDCDDWVKEMLGVVETNFATLYDFIEKQLPCLKCIKAEGTYLAWIDMRALGMSDKEIEKMHLDAYLALDEGYIFGANGSGFARWNLALPTAELVAALERLEKAVNAALANRV